MAFLSYDGHEVFYNVIGEGEPLLLLHGNSVSSSLFKTCIPFFSKYYKVIVFDYPGHGKSGRLSEFREDFWSYNADVAIALLEFLNIEKLKVIGTSGGALVGLNICVKRIDLVTQLIADSFFGNYIDYDEIQKIVQFRRKAIKDDFMMQQYWKSNNGENWENVVNNDIDFMMKLAEKQLPFIYGDVSKIKSEVLFVATSSDELIKNIIERTKELADKVLNSSTAFYHTGRHTFMITEKVEFRRIALEFFRK